MTLPEHAACSIMIAQFGVRQHYGTRGVLAVLAAGLMPDLDVVSKLFGDQHYWYYHHAVGHCLLSILFLAALCSFVGSRKLGAGGFLFLFGFCLASAAAHVVTDMLYWFAVKPLWPFSNYKVAWSIIEYCDTIVLAIWLVGAICLYKYPNSCRKIAFITLTTFTAYVALRAMLPKPTGIFHLITGGWMYAPPKNSGVLDWW